MKQTHPFAAVWFSLAALLAMPALAHAQASGGRPSRPQISPYAAMGSRSPALNYFTITRPSLEARSLLSRQEGEIKSLEKRMDSPKVEGSVRGGAFEFTLPRTGHKTYFSNHSHYYPSR